MTQIIGLSGIARSGKDAFCEYLITQLQAQGKSAKRFALADELKQRIRQPLLDLCGIDAVTITGKDKELIRDYLVAVGKIKRFQSEGKYWTGKLEEKIKDEHCLDYAIITDIRYDVFPEDEVWWVKEHMKGKFVHIRRYDVINDDDMWDYHHNPNVLKDHESNEWRLFVQPPNEDERVNDPKLMAKADYKVCWSSAPDLSQLNIHCAPYVRAFLRTLDKN